MKNNSLMPGKTITGTLLILFLVSFSVICCAETYSYDDQGRLTKVVYDDSSSIAYSYDSMGNRTEAKTVDVSSSEDGGGGILSLNPLYLFLVICIVIYANYKRIRNVMYIRK